MTAQEPRAQLAENLIDQVDEHLRRRREGPVALTFISSAAGRRFFDFLNGDSRFRRRLIEDTATLPFVEVALDIEPCGSFDALKEAIRQFVDQLMDETLRNAIP